MSTSPLRCQHCNCWRRAAGGPCRGCAYWARRAEERRAGRRCHHCGTLLPAETHSRCDTCRELRRRPDWEHRREQATAAFPAAVRARLIARLTAGEHLAEVCQDLGITQQRVHGYRAYAPDWSEDLDAALLAGRDPELDHGTVGAYRHGRCRCPECREAKASPPLWWRQRSSPAQPAGTPA
ncbi:hypothetical protein ACGFX7_05970 [Streptomyces harbinensis]|uniref:hypothetical protein n=1 Tax=Streptomyces harbinensis TaxID=1176198 RepID=UPI0037130177